MTEKGKNDPSYEWVTLRDTNIDHIASITGHRKTVLKQLLEARKEEGEYEVQIPLGVNIFTRKER